MTSLPNLSLPGKEEDNLVLAESSFRTRSPSEVSLTPFVDAPRSSLSEQQLKRNLAVLSVSCALSFGALSTCQAVQSSLSPRPSLGVASFAGIYACAALSSLAGPSIVQLLGVNTSALLGSIAGLAFVAAHLSPRLLTLAPSGAVLGLCLGPWLSGRVSVLLNLLSRYCDLGEEVKKDKLLHKFFLIFNFALNSGDVIAHLITCLILTPNIDNGLNETRTLIQNGGRSVCGSKADCGFGFNLTRSGDVLTRDTWMWLVSAMTAGSLAGVVLIGVGLSRIDVPEQQDPLERPPALIYLRQVCRTFVNSKLLFCLPLVFCAGFQHGLMLTDFTKFYVHCALSASHVGWTVLCSAVTHLIAGLIVPLLTRHIPRIAILLAALSFQLGLLIVLWLWKPEADDVPVFYVIAGGWGICKAVWDTMAFPVVAMTIADVWQAPIAAYDFARTAGLATAFSIHRMICSRVKILTLLIVFPIFVVIFAVFDNRLQRIRKLRAITTYL